MYQPVRLAKIYARPLQNNKTSVKRIQPQLDFKNSYKSRRLKYEKYNFLSNNVFSKSEYHISPAHSTFKLINKVYLIHFVAVEFLLLPDIPWNNNVCIFQESVFDKHCVYNNISTKILNKRNYHRDTGTHCMYNLKWLSKKLTL